MNNANKRIGTQAKKQKGIFLVKVNTHRQHLLPIEKSGEAISIGSQSFSKQILSGEANYPPDDRFQ